MIDMRQQFEVAIAALCAWREARGEGIDGIRAVLHVIHNRSKAQHKTPSQIVYSPMQFTSMTYRNDPQLSAVPPADDVMLLRCMALSEHILNGQDEDITNGASYYFNPHVVVPGWASHMEKVASIGNHDFYKQV